MTPGRGGAVPGGLVPGGLVPGGFTPGGFTPGGLVPGGFTPGGLTPGGLVPGGFDPGAPPRSPTDPMQARPRNAALASNPRHCRLLGMSRALLLADTRGNKM